MIWPRSWISSPIPRVVLQPESNALDSANRSRILTVRFIIPACKKQAQRALREAGVRARGQRAVIDQAAAVGILQNWLDQRRAALSPHGEARDG